MAKTRTVYVCSQCGNDSPKWLGKCPACGEWNTYVEEIIKKDSPSQAIVHLSNYDTLQAKPVLLQDIDTGVEIRINLPDEELNRVLGGGMVPGSLILIGGEPGIGKSTLVLQTALKANRHKVLYVSGEESAKQLKLRAERIGNEHDNCLFFVKQT